MYESPAVGDRTPGETTTWEIEDLGLGDEGEIRIRGTVDPLTVPGTLLNEVRISATEPDSNRADNSASVTNGVVAPDLPNLTVGKTGLEETRAAETITYTIGWANTGAVAAPGVVLTDTLPAGTEGTFVLTATVGVDAAGPLVNHVRIASEVGDSDAADNADQWMTEVSKRRWLYLPLILVQP